METLFIQNPWWNNPQDIEEDLKIQEFNRSPVKIIPPLLNRFNLKEDAIYTLRGPRQVGKSTLIKLLIKNLLDSKINPRRVFFYRCDLLTSAQSLSDLIQKYLDFAPSARKYIFLDEVSFIPEWSRGIKLLADSGKLQGITLILTGSLSLELKGGPEKMPGRRGKLTGLDKIMMPLSFGEYVRLFNKNFIPPFPPIDLWHLKKNETELMGFHLKSKKYLGLLYDYLLTGGFIKVINDYQQNKNIPENTINLYLQSLKGDWLKMERNEDFIWQILQNILKSLGSTVNWHNIAANSTIGSHVTVQENVSLLQDMFLVKILPNLDLNSKLPNFRKEKKIIFLDPLFINLLQGYLEGFLDLTKFQQQLLIKKEPSLIENLAQAHLMRIFKNSAFWRGDDGEIDFIGKVNGKLYGAKIKWQDKIDSADVKNLEKVDYGIVLTKSYCGQVGKLWAVPVLAFLTTVQKSYIEEN